MLSGQLLYARFRRELDAAICYSQQDSEIDKAAAERVWKEK